MKVKDIELEEIIISKKDSEKYEEEQRRNLARLKAFNQSED